jgi:hypothetical protein
MKYKYTIEQLKEAITTSNSIREVLMRLNIIPAGGNYATLKKQIKLHKLDISHFKGKSWNKNRKFGHKRPIASYLCNQFSITSHRLRQRLIQEGLFKPQCSNCNLKSWLGKNIPLELDHIDGDHENNNLCNLRLLCPNCHALTPNYRGKNIKM